MRLGSIMNLHTPPDPAKPEEGHDNLYRSHIYFTICIGRALCNRKWLQLGLFRTLGRTVRTIRQATDNKAAEQMAQKTKFSED